MAATWTLSCGGKSDAARRDTAGTPASQIVPVARVVRSTLTNNLVVTGEFVPYQEIDVMAKEAGYIKSIRVDIGDRVKTGQFLAELEIPEMQNDIARAEASVQASQADIDTARGDLARAQSTSDIADLSYKRILEVSKKEPGLIPQQEVDVARSKQLETAGQVVVAQANIQTAERKLAMAKAEEARWKTLKNYTIITAPFTGLITKRYANTGAMIQQGTASETQAMPVVRLSQNNLLRLILPVPESAVPNVRIGENVDVSVNSLRKKFPGKVTRFEGKVSMTTRTMNTEVDVPNPDYILVPGMYAEVNLKLRQSKSALAVPLDAVEESGDSAQVYVVHDSVIRVVPVEVGIKSAQLQEIVSGVAAGEMVVVGRHAGLQNGQSVTPKPAQFEQAAALQTGN